MEQLLIEFINTLDLSLKKMQKDVGDTSGFSRLTISQLQYLDAIQTLGNPTITDLAHCLNITKASVTAGINKLIAAGFVTKTQSEEDKRVFRVSLNKAGQQIARAKAQALKDYGDFINAALSETEARQFEKILTKLVNVFKER